MGITLSDVARRHLTLFEEVTGANGVDCVQEADRLLVVVARGGLGQAIGPRGRHVQAFEEQIGQPVRLIEDAETAAEFVANTLSPAAVYNVTISENRDTVAYVEVASEDRGVAIGTEGRTIETARTLAARHFGIDDVQLV